MRTGTLLDSDTGFFRFQSLLRLMGEVAFVRVGNAGRSQMATALAEREREQRGLNIDTVTGGVDPADSIHDEAVDVLNEAGTDISDREPRRITPADTADAAHVVTMGCSVDQFRPDNWTGTSRRWDLEATDTRDRYAELSARISGFFDELEQEMGPPRAESEELE